MQEHVAGCKFTYYAMFTVPLIGQKYKTLNLHNHLTLASLVTTISGHVAIPLDIRHFLLEVFRTMRLSLALSGTLGHKDNWVTTLTFLGQVTSSVT